MKIAVIGSRGLRVNNLEKYLPKNTTEIVSGGAIGIDTCAKNYALSHKIKLAFWDGESHGTKYVIENCKKQNKQVKIFKKI